MDFFSLWFPPLVFLIDTFARGRQLPRRVECDCVFQVEQKSAGPVFRNARVPTRVVSILFFQLIFRDNSNLKTKNCSFVFFANFPTIIKSFSWCPQCDDPHVLSGVHYFHLFFLIIFEISTLKRIKFFFNTSTCHDRILISGSVGLYPHQLRGHDRQSHRFSPDIKPANTAHLTKHCWVAIAG